MNHHTRFDTAAATYNHHATLQHKIGDSLVSYVELPIKGTVLDFGCGTGHLTRKLVSTTTSVIGYDQSESMINVAKNESRTESECRWTSCLTDAERYAPFDFIISNATLQWVPDLTACIDWMRHHITCQGRLLISVFGPETFKELAEIWPTPIVATQFRPITVYKKEFSHYFDSISVNEHEERQGYASLSDLLRTIKGTGAYVPMGSGLVTPRKMAALDDRYRTKYGDITATYQYAILELIAR